MNEYEERVAMLFAPLEDGISQKVAAIDKLRTELEYRENELEQIEYWRKLFVKCYVDIEREEEFEEQRAIFLDTHEYVSDGKGKSTFDPPPTDYYLKLERDVAVARYMLNDFDLKVNVEQLLNARRRTIRRERTPETWFDVEEAEKNL